MKRVCGYLNLSLIPVTSFKLVSFHLRPPNEDISCFSNITPKTAFFMALRDTNADSICNVLVVWCSLLPFSLTHSFCVIFLFFSSFFISFSPFQWTYRTLLSCTHKKALQVLNKMLHTSSSDKAVQNFLFRYINMCIIRHFNIPMHIYWNFSFTTFAPSICRLLSLDVGRFTC